jgi:heme oxygenase
MRRPQGDVRDPVSDGQTVKAGSPFVVESRAGGFVTLSEYLREGTAEVHREAERSTFVGRFVNGRLDRDTYSRHLLALHSVYTALEDGLERRREDRRVGAFFLPELWRRSALTTDLTFLRGPEWVNETPISSARLYAGHLAEIEETIPIRLVAHAYVRYLGDLSGGQMLKRMAARCLGLNGAGLSFYEFPEISDPPAFKADFRRRLDELSLDDGEREGLLDEATTAFKLNGAIFDELTRTENG